MKRRCKLCALTALLSLVASSVLAAEPIEPASTSFTAMDVFELEYASDPRVAPDEKSLVYVRHAQDVMTDRTRSSLWQMNVDGSEHRPLLADGNNYTTPRWSPDGERLAYVSNESGRSQVHVRWMDSGRSAMVTSIDKGVRSLTFSPDGKWLAFTMSVPGSPTSLVKPRKKPKGATWSEAPRVIDTVRYQFDGRGIVEPEYRHIFVLPAEGGTPRQLTDGDYQHNGPLSFSPDSKQILFSANRHESWELETIEADVFAINVSDGALTQLTSEPGAESEPAFSPDGKRIAWLKSANEPLAYRNTRLIVAGADGGDPVSLTEDLDRSIDEVAWHSDSKHLYVRYDDRGHRNVDLVDLSGERRAITNELGGTTWGRPYTSGSFAAVGNVVAFTRGSTGGPAEIATVVRGKTRLVTDLNSELLGHRTLGTINRIAFPSSFDGQEIEGWYVMPPDFDPAKKYPLILEIHGGPHASYGPWFSAEIQLMAAAGYIVVYDNHRGSTSYGEAFALLLQHKYASEEDFSDHMSAVDKVIDMGFIDTDNLFITGGSAGGIGTAYAIGLTDRFNAAVAAKPVINWVSKTLTADSSLFQIRHQFPGMPWEELEHYWKRSPLSLVGNVTTPTMLITGEEDRRTPISETEQFYQALKLKGVDAMMVRLPDSSHGIASRPSRLITKVDYILAWFEKYRHGDEETTP